MHINRHSARDAFFLYNHGLNTIENRSNAPGDDARAYGTTSNGAVIDTATTRKFRQ